MNYPIYVFSGVLLLVFVSFVSAFYADLRKNRIMRARKRRMRAAGQKNNEEMSAQKIPGYYREIMNRSKQNEAYTNSRPTII